MDLSEMDKRLRVLEDIEEIKKLHGYYVDCIIKTQWDEATDCFAENGTFDAHAGIARGKKAVYEIFTQEIYRNHIGMEGLIAVHPNITVDGDTATGSWLLYIQYALPRRLEVKLEQLPSHDAPDWIQGYYDMKYIREDGKWKISYLKFRCRLWSTITDNSSNSSN